MAPTSPLQTLLKPKITTTVSATFRFTYTNASSNNLSTLSKAAHNLKSMIYKYKLEQQGFPQYSRLPLEIQRKIWIYTFPDPRVVPINYDYVNNICESTCSTPVALRVCSVSRVEALRCYSLSFGTTTENGRIYFRFGFDIPLLLTNIFCNVGPVILPVEKLERFVKTTKNLEKLDTVAMIPGMIKSVFGPHPRPRPYLCDTLIARLPALKILLSANCTRETDDLTIGMSGFLTSYKTIGTKKCSDLSLSMKAYALGKDAQHRTDNFKKFWGIHWNQAYLELHGLPLVLVADEYLKENEVRQFSRVGDEWGIAPSIRSVLNPFLGL